MGPGTASRASLARRSRAPWPSRRGGGARAGNLRLTSGARIGGRCDTM
jgi:hypothetical protein